MQKKKEEDQEPWRVMVTFVSWAVVPQGAWELETQVATAWEWGDMRRAVVLQGACEHGKVGPMWPVGAGEAPMVLQGSWRR